MIDAESAQQVIKSNKMMIFLFPIENSKYTNITILYFLNIEIFWKVCLNLQMMLLYNINMIKTKGPRIGSGRSLSDSCSQYLHQPSDIWGLLLLRDPESW